MSDADRDAAAAEWLVRLSEAELEAGERAELDAWLDADPDNGAMLEEIAGSWRAVESYASALPVMALREEALASARVASERAHRPEPKRGREWGWWGAIAATLLLCLLGTGYWLANQPTAYTTGSGERRVVMLADGSRLSLDASTTVLVHYTAGRRQLWLERGRAKFDVAHDPLSPFTVDADDRVVVATGTSFSVELLGKQVRVALYEGQVSVLREADVQRYRRGASPTSVAAGGVRMAQVGRELVVDEDDGTPPSFAAIDPVRSVSWQSGILDIEDDPVAIIVERVNRSAQRKLVLGDARVGAMRVSGVFRAGDTDALVEGLDAALGIRATRTADRIILHAPAATPAG